jgi:hypothetical protein
MQERASVLKLSCAALIAATVAACQASTVTECRVFAPINGSKLDTERTRHQIDRHNARGVGACGWRP